MNINALRVRSINSIRIFRNACVADGVEGHVYYAINPEDRRKLQEKIRELPGAAPLLRCVGSFKSDEGDGSIFDLVGNVAEWVDDEGVGRALGGSADVPVGERGKLAPAPSYIGFRVVRK